MCACGPSCEREALGDGSYYGGEFDVHSSMAALGGGSLVELTVRIIRARRRCGELRCDRARASSALWTWERGE